METFQDLSLPIPGKEDLAKLHSAIYQNVPAKPGACGDSYSSQGWLAFIVEYIRRYAHPPAIWGYQSGLTFLGLQQGRDKYSWGPGEPMEQGSCRPGDTEEFAGFRVLITLG